MSTSQVQRALLRAQRRSQQTTVKQPEPPEAAPAFAPKLVDYDVDTCARFKVLVSEVLPSQIASSAAYRVLRTRFLHRAQSNRWNTIGISSPGQGDGKSVTALNLALTLARTGTHSVFLVDLDLRRPKMWQYLGASPDQELTEYFNGHTKVEDVLFSIGVPNLTVAGALTGTSQASELLAGPRVPELFSFIKSTSPNALVLVDLPPLLSTDDALIMAAKLDACLLVVSEARTRRDSTAKALELLEDFNLAGIVLNRSKAMVSDYYTAY